MKNLSLKLKIAICVTVSILAIGVALVSIFGFNNTAADSNGYELSVKAEANIGSVSSVMKNSVENYLKDKNVKVSKTVEYDDGGQYVFVFGKDYKDAINVDEIAASVKAAFQSNEILSGLDVTVKYNQAVNGVYSQSALYVAFALILSAAVIFVYTAIAEKSLASALGTLCPSVIAALLFFAVMGITRIPAGEFFAVPFATSILFTAVLSLVLVNRFSEEAKLVSSGKPDYEEITKVGVEKGFLRLCISASAVCALGLLTFLFGISGDMKWAGLQIIIAAIVSAFSTLFFTDITWKTIKTLGKGKNPPTNKETAQEN